MLDLAQKNFQRWNSALQTGDASQVAALYTASNTFLPTLSPEFKQGIQGAEEYFTHFLQKQPVGTVIAEEVQSLSEKIYIHSGLYNFAVGPSEQRSIAEARFTFVWIKEDDGQWKIAHHHSSLKPQAD
jgi:uncharacterized protein (TIGR02246 family)